MKLAPIVLFVYNRVKHAQKTINYLKTNSLAESSDLYIFSDAWKSEKDAPLVYEVRKYLYTIKGFNKVTVIEREKNLGLAKSIITGLNYIFDEFDSAIILEDDLITSEDFLKFMNSALDHYKGDNCICSITGYTLPISIPSEYPYDAYLSIRPSSWGWGTWKSEWENVDWKVSSFDSFKNNKEMKRKFNRGGEDLTNMLFSQMSGKIDSWAIRWAYHHFITKSFCITPIASKVQNIGADSSGTHIKSTKKYDVNFGLVKNSFNFPPPSYISQPLISQIYDYMQPSLIRKFVSAFKYALKH